MLLTLEKYLVIHETSLITDVQLASMNVYDPATIENRWLQEWEQSQLFQGKKGERRHLTKSEQEKFYALFAFAYPSGSGLHVGHVESKTALDIFVRFLRMQGKDVFFPVGWDAFGLPAENYAIKTGIHPRVTTKTAIDTFRRQIKRLAISYDWSTELATCHPAYYKWTQWIFIQLFQAGLAYRDTGWVNWCPQDKTVLANEQVVNGECERCGASVVQKELEQWKFKITAYQDELLDGLQEVDWPKATKIQQENWIGKSEGVTATFLIQGFGKEKKQIEVECFTTRLDTIYGVTFVVISPEKFKELALIELVDDGHKNAVNNYLDASFHKTEEQRRVGEKEKTGVDTRIELIHPLTGEKIPLWIADYVLAGYGTGVVMGVPAHDARDNAFAKKFDLPIIEVIEGKSMKKDELFSGYGTVINSAEYSGMESLEVIEKICSSAPTVFRRTTTYKLRDWLISRQRYWGAPIPMVFCENCGWQAVPEDQLPVVLPDLEDFTPTDDGLSPIEKAPDTWKFSVCPKCKGVAKREVDTMDTFVDSSWYFLRYASRDRDDVVFDKELTQRILPVDLYLIGPEHIVLHLLYARFFTKFLRDQGYLTCNEPFLKMRHQGMILGPDGKKMSKSKGNVINPDEIIEKFGADSLRMYEMFMGPLDADKAWDTNSLVGVYRFLSRIYSLFEKNLGQIQTNSTKFPAEVLQRKLHWAIDKITRDIPDLKFNTSIAALMELTNEWAKAVEDAHGFTSQELVIISKLLAPFAPFLAEELFAKTGGKDSVHLQEWPTADSRLLTQEEVEIVVQINGKVKEKMTVSTAASLDTSLLEKDVVLLPRIQALLQGKSVRKIITIPGKLINIVV